VNGDFVFRVIYGEPWYSDIFINFAFCWMLESGLLWDPGDQFLQFYMKYTILYQSVMTPVNVGLELG
jgi:hypothetical protein